MSAIKLVRSLTRPNSLVETARFGVATYPRSSLLRRLLGPSESRDPESNLTQLIEMEGFLNDQRKNRRAEYFVRDHVEVLIAILGEYQILVDAKPV